MRQNWLTRSNKFPVSQFFSDVTLDPMFKYLVKICVNILFKDLDLALFFILDIKTEKIIEKCPEKCPETANYYTTLTTVCPYLKN